MTICEATSCDLWGVGVAPNLAQYTKPSRFLAKNNMGKLQMALRLYVSGDGVLNEKDQMVLPRKPSGIDDCQDSSLETEVLPSFSGQELIISIEGEASISNEEIPPPAPSTLISSKTAITTTIPQPTVNSGVSPNTAPLRPPRRIAAVRRNSSSASGSSKINTLDNFIIKDSPTKRKPSGEAGSPSLIQVNKSTRTDGADSVS